MPCMAELIKHLQAWKLCDQSYGQKYKSSWLYMFMEKNCCNPCYNEDDEPLHCEHPILSVVYKLQLHKNKRQLGDQEAISHSCNMQYLYKDVSICWYNQ